MTEIVDYKVVWGNSINDINKTVNSCISVGWVPQGGISIKDYVDPNHFPQTLFAQAMVLYAQK